MTTIPPTETGLSTARRARRPSPDSDGTAGPEGRLLGIDVLRALAILGMVWAHFVLTGWTSAAPQGQAPSQSLTWVNGLLGTRSREIFFLLAGLSIALMTGGFKGYAARARSAAMKRVAVRAGVLFVLALVLGWMGDWQVQILHYYAFWLLLLLPLSLLRARTLLVIAGVLAVAAPIFKIAADHAGTAWAFLPNPMDPTFMQLHGGFALLVNPGDWWPTFQGVVFGLSTGSQDTVSVLPFLVLGLALGKLDLRSHAVRLRLLAAGAGTAAAAVLVSLIAMYPLGAVQAVNDYKNPPAMTAPADGGADAAGADAGAGGDAGAGRGTGSGTDPGAAGAQDPAGAGADAAAAAAEVPPLPKAPWQELVTMGHPGPAEKTLSATEGVTMLGLIAALLGGLLSLMDRPMGGRLLQPFAAFGSMALTWYFAHFIILERIPATQGMPGAPAGRSALAFAIFMVAVLAVSVLWRRFFRRGPLEWLTHRVITLAVPRREPSRQAAPGQ